MYITLGMRKPLLARHETQKIFKTTFLLHFHISRFLKSKDQKKHLEKTVLYDKGLMPLRNGPSKCINKNKKTDKIKK